MKRADIYQGGQLIVSEVPIHLITKHRPGGATERYGTLKPLQLLDLQPGAYDVRQDNGQQYNIIITHLTAGGAVAELPFVVSKGPVKE